MYHAGTLDTVLFFSDLIEYVLDAQLDRTIPANTIIVYFIILLIILITK